MASISVIIPAYRDAVRLEKTLLRLRDIRAASSVALEIVVSVRPSTDDTLAVARRLADKVALTYGLVSTSRNDGAAFAEGEFLVFLDADILPTADVFRAILSRAAHDTFGTCTAVPSRAGWKSALAIHFQNALRALHLVKGANLLFCHRSLFFDKGVRYDESLNIGEHHDFCKRALKSGARYRYFSVPHGFEVDVGRYERSGYLRTFCFWLSFSFHSLLFGRAGADAFSRLYWDTKKRVSYGTMFAPLIREAHTAMSTLSIFAVWAGALLFLSFLF